MAAGMNLRLDVWRVSYSSDDVVGGAQPTGTVAYSNIYGRWLPSRPTQEFLEQGLETEKIYRMALVPGTLLIYERDEIEIKKPLNHKYKEKFFRVLGVEETSMHPNDPRGQIILTLSRSERAHGEQYQ